MNPNDNNQLWNKDKSTQLLCDNKQNHVKVLNESNQLLGIDKQNQLGVLDKSNLLLGSDKQNQLGVLDKSNPLWVQSKDNLHKPMLIQADALKLCNPLQLYCHKYAGQVIKLPYSNLLVKYIVDYLNHHRGHKPPEISIPLRSNNMYRLCFDAFDAKFINRVAECRSELYELCHICSSKHLDIPSLWSLCCAKIAALIKGKPRSQLNTLLLN